MKKIKKSTFLLCIFICMFLQTGCWDQKIFEKIGFILQLGVELDANKNLLYTAGIPVISPDIKSKIQVVSTNAKLLREGQEKSILVSGKTVESGKVQHIYFSQEVAEKGIDSFLELFLRSPENPMVANVIIVDGSPNELIRLSGELMDKPRPSVYVNDLLESSRRSSYSPETRVFHFERDTHSGTIDPVAPLVRLEKKEIEILGEAIFSGDKMVGKINIKDATLLNAIIWNKRNMNYIYEGEYSKDKENNIKSGAAIEMKVKSRDIKVRFRYGVPYIDIALDIKGAVSEYSGNLDFSDPNQKKKFEEDVAKAMKRDYSKLLKYLVELQADPVGIGEIVRSKENSYWKAANWKKEYKKAQFNVEPKLNLEFYGAITKS